MTPETETFVKKHSKRKLLPMWHVILLDDDAHSYDYVIEMLAKVFSHNIETAYIMALEVDSTGQVIVDTCHKERAEFKQEQVHNYGADPLIANCVGPMTAVLERA